MSPYFNAVVVPISEVPMQDQGQFEANHGPIVLVVDDEQLVADTLTLIFQRAGYCALKAYDAASALEIASAIKPDILVTDVDMPMMNGVELAMTLLKGSPECRILLFSGHASFSDLEPAYSAGYDFPLLTKPVHPDELLNKVAKTLRPVTEGWSQVNGYRTAMADTQFAS